MLEIENCLKISYNGEESFIICEPGSKYENIIDKACDRFHIPEAQKPGLVLTNGQGYEFDRHLLEYFLLLFPCPELIFQLRVDWQKIRRASVEPPKRRRSTGDLPEPQPEPTNDHTDYEAVPVHRQNCFIGALPETGARRQNCALREQRLLQLQQSTSRTLDTLKSVRTSPETHARRMRLQLNNKSRRTYPGTDPYTALPSRTSRSIRI